MDYPSIAHSFTHDFLSGTVAASASVSGEHWYATPFFYLGLGLTLSLLSLFGVVLLWRSEKRRLRSGVAMLAHAAEKLADEREYCEVNTGSNRDLVSMSSAFNRISAMMQTDAGRVEKSRARLEQLVERINRFQAVSARLSALSDAGSLQEEFVRTLVVDFGFRQANLWLLHRYVKRWSPRSTRTVRDQPADSDTQDILEKVGLLPACRSEDLLNGTESGQTRRPPHRGILEVAMTSKEVSCQDIRASPLFKGMESELAEKNLNAYLGVPLILRSGLIGVIEVYSETPFSVGDTQLLRLLASQAASLVAAIHSTEEIIQSQEAYETKNLELQMANRRLQRTNTQLEEADRLKSEFLANTSHELRTPLNSILGFAQLILAGACADEGEVHSNVEAIQESGERLLKLINEVLDLAKIEAGKLSVTLAPVDVRPIVDAAVALLKIQADTKNLELKVEMPEEELLPVRADHTKLYQILINLLGNAVKFTVEGSITVRIISERVPGFMTLEVQDTGIGISPEILSRLFQNFVQGDGSVTRRFGGTGLGLVISQKMADLQGGLLELTSKGEGTGALATLMLPLWSGDLEDEDERLRSREARAPVASARTTVVVEDYLEFQQYMVEILEDRGWHVVTARTAREGLELIQSHVPDAIVLDMHLPWDDEDPSIRSGYDIVKLLGRDRELNTIPILIVTGMPKKAANLLLTQTVLNPLELYGKPLDERGFFEALERLTGRKKTTSIGK